MDQSVCFLCKSPNNPPVFNSKFNCPKHTQEFPDCGNCDNSLDVCLFCKNEPQTVPNLDNKQSTNNKANFLYLINTKNNDKNAFTLVSLEIDTLKSDISYISPKSQEEKATINEYSGIVQSNSKEYLMTGGIDLQGVVTSSVLLFRFEPIGEIYHYLVEEMPKLLAPRYAHKAFAIESKRFIVAGGMDKDRNFLKTCEIFEDGVWKAGPELIKHRSQPSGFVHNDYLYIFGGFNGPKVQETTFERLNLKELKNWEEIKVNANNFVYMTGCQTIEYKSQILLLGGSNGKKTNVDIFVLDLNKFEIIQRKECMESGRANMGVALVENQLLVLGGEKDKEVKVERLGLEAPMKMEVWLDEQEGEHYKFNEPGYYWFQLN